jgi:type IV secretory pathway VirB10-like protein
VTRRRTGGRDHRFQRAALIASVVALVAMLGFAVAMNVHPSSPIPHSMVQNPVQEKSPFGAASITPVTTTTTKPVATKPAAHAALPQNDAAPVKPPAAKVTKPSPTRTRRAARDNYVAEDEVVVHHYGATAQKHPPAAQTQAGVRKYTDQE